eukprot:scaffold34933_cov33-Phaeocystis_antarctica.AAC.1
MCCSARRHVKSKPGMAGQGAAWGSPRLGLALKEAFGAPAGRRLRRLILDVGSAAAQLDELYEWLGLGRATPLSP